MGFSVGHTPNHKGEMVTEEPIRSLEAIKHIKGMLYTENRRDYALFVVGINTAFRCGDLVSITVGDVRGKKAGDDVVVREEKTGKLRRVTLNDNSAEAIDRLLRTIPEANDHDFLFSGQRGKMSVSYVNRLVKRWCSEAGLNGQFGSHTLRKTWGYHQRVTFGSDIEHLMLAYNHSSPRQTLTYLCIQPDEMKEIYANSL